MTRQSIWAVLAATLIILAGCGGSDETPLKPEDENPFRALVAGTDSTLDIATWNLHGFAESAETVGLVADAIVAMNLDVVALQEIAMSSRFNQLVQQLPGWAGYRAPSGGEWSLAYLWRTDTITIGPDAIYEIFTDQGNPFPRAPLVFDFTYDGQAVRLVNNHLKAFGDGDLVPGDSDDEEYRRYLAGELLEDWIATEADGQAVVMLGDLNDKLDDVAADNVFQMFLDLPTSYRFADWDLAVGPRGGWSWGPGESHLDHILVTDELFPALGTCRTVRLDLALASGVFADKISDHAPVSVTLDLDTMDENPFHGFVAGTDSTLDIATWNLHGFAASAGAETVDLVTDAITAMDLDVIALQEIAWSSDFDRLVNQLPGWAGYRAPSGGEWSLAYLWHTDTITVGPEAIYEIYQDQGAPFPRAPLVFEFNYDGKAVHLINNHLKCCGDGDLVPGDYGDEEFRRYRAGEMLEDWIAAEAAGRAVVMLGDLNDRLNDPVADNVFQMFLDLPASYRFADWDIAVDSSHAQWSWGPGESHLDHILVTDELFPALRTCRTMRLDLALAAGVFADKISDHAPVVVTLDLDAR